jgi:uncharacterized protein YkwD
MRYRHYLALTAIAVALLSPSARAQGYLGGGIDGSGGIDGILTFTNTTTQTWMAAGTHAWVVNTDQDPAALATWTLNVPQSGRAYEIQLFIPAPALVETRPRTNTASYEIRSAGGGVTRFTLNQAVLSSQWVRVPAGLTFDLAGTYQLHLSGKTNEPAGTRVIVASNVRLVPTSGSGTPGEVFPIGSEFALTQRAYDLINQVRQQAGVPPLNRSAALDAAEFEHVRDMARNNFVSADGSNGQGPSARATRHGYSPRQLVNWISVGEKSAEQLMRDYPSDILNPLYTDVGIAVAVGTTTAGRQEIYWSIVVAVR